MASPRREISKGAAFPGAWRQFVEWTDELLNMAVVGHGKSDSEDGIETRRMPESPTLLMAAHNGQTFEFPLCLCKCLSHNVACDV